MKCQQGLSLSRRDVITVSKDKRWKGKKGKEKKRKEKKGKKGKERKENEIKKGGFLPKCQFLPHLSRLSKRKESKRKETKD